MAVSNAHISVGTTATLLSAKEQDTRADSTLTVLNVGDEDVSLGDADVTTSNGLKLAPDASFSVTLQHGEKLYGIVATATEDVHVLRTGV